MTNERVKKFVKQLKKVDYLADRDINEIFERAYEAKELLKKKRRKYTRYGD